MMHTVLLVLVLILSAVYVGGYQMTTKCAKYCSKKDNVSSSFVGRRVRILKNTKPFTLCGLATIIRSPHRNDRLLALCNPNGGSRAVAQVVDIESWHSLLRESRPVPWDHPEDPVPSEALVVSADARLFEFNKQIFMIYYRKHPALQLTRLHVHTNDTLVGIAPSTVHIYHNFRQHHPEKNWGPFEYPPPSAPATATSADTSPAPQLLFVYTINPHVVVGFGADTAPMTEYHSLKRTGVPMFPRFCTQLVASELAAGGSGPGAWAARWGQWRGGTPAVYIPSARAYMSFFHSKATVHDPVVHTYFMGAYLFDVHPPFRITHMSSEPIVARDFYTGQFAFPKLDFVNYPMSFVLTKAGTNSSGAEADVDTLWLSYGRQDVESWVVEMELAGLLASLEPVRTEEVPCEKTYGPDVP
jgi:hypothetical protein